MRNRRTLSILCALTTLLVLYFVSTQTTLYSSYSSLNSQLTSADPSPAPPAPLDSVGKTPKILLVSALFPLAKSKHSHEEYEAWLSKFLGSITTSVYFYAPPSLAATVLAARGNQSIHLNTTYSSPFDIPPLLHLESTYEHLHTLDREAFRHNPELYAVWNAKPWLLDNAVQHLRDTSGEEYDYAFWNDAGSFRSEHAYKQWPSPQRVEQVWREGAALSGGPAEELIFFPLAGGFPWSKRYWREDDGPVDVDISEGSFYGGSPSSVSWLSKTFYAYHDYYLKKGFFVGKDQTVLNSLFLLFPSRFINVWSGDPSARPRIPHFDSGPQGECGGSWWYYQFFLAAKEDREAMQTIWMKDLEGKLGWPWKDWDWWLQRQQCMMTRVVWMRDVVLGAFGKGWSVVSTVEHD